MITPSTSALGLDFDTPVQERYFEDYTPGSTYTYGSVTLTEEDILRFADEFDPQSIHSDPDAAAEGPFQGLIASGWHTASVMMRLYADHYISKVASLASPGVDELRWTQPVRPGDSLSIRTTVRAARLSRSKPDRGLVHTDIEVLNQRGDTVLTLTAMNLLRRRDAN
ncbi:MaoC family dehydratase [Streptomyces pseudoechinosporeus]